MIICTISRGEILFGLERLAARRRPIELEEKAAKLFAVLPCEPISAAAGDRYAKVKASAVAFTSMRTTFGSPQPPSS